MTEGPSEIADGITAYLVGGLGNQLFILAAAWAQAARLGCPLYVDASWYRHQGLRAHESRDVPIPAVDVTDRSPWAVRPLNPDGDQSPLDLAVGAAHGLTVFREGRGGFTHDPQIDLVRPGTTIVGYYQDTRYFETIARDLALAMWSTRFTPEEEAFVESRGDEPTAAVHVRRGDYLTPSVQAHHGIAGRAYFERAIALYGRLHPETTYRIFTDSRDHVAAEFAGVAHAELAPPDDGLRPLASLLAMAVADGIVISNSSFSWWSAWLLTLRDPAATVVAPRPWLRGGESASTLLGPDWITLGAN